MKFKDYITTTQVFTVDSLRDSLDSEGSLRTSLARAIKSGEIERVRKGLYVSKTGKFTGEKADAHLVATALDNDAVFVYHSALDLHGVAHNVSFRTTFRSAQVVGHFDYDGMSYVRYPDDENLATQQLRAKAFGLVNVTTREQTLVDCLMHPARAGGIEETIRSLSTFTYIDCTELDRLLEKASASLLARVGWLLESCQDSWHISNDLLLSLEARLMTGPYRMDNKSSRSQGWSKRWKLCLPESVEEVCSWTP